MAKRKYNDSYIKLGFTLLNDQGIEKRQCVVCYHALSNKSLRPSKLSHHHHISYQRKELKQLFKFSEVCLLELCRSISFAEKSYSLRSLNLPNKQYPASYRLF